MDCTATVRKWMFQICAIDIWPCCDCGYFYFYDAMTCMEKILSNSYREPTDKERYSLAAACVVKSFQRLNPGDPGWQALMHLIVHRLQRVNRTDAYFYVSGNDIRALLSQIDLDYFACSNVSGEDMVLDEESESEDKVKYLDMFLNEGLENIRRPVVQIPHAGCWSQHLSVLSHGINDTFLRRASEAVSQRLQDETYNDADQQLRQEASVFCPRIKTPEILIESVQQVLTFRAMALYGPWMNTLAPRQLVWLTSPEYFWCTKNYKWPPHRWLPA